MRHLAIVKDLLTGVMAVCAAAITVACVCRFIDHGRYEDQLAEAGLSASHIASTALSVLGKPKDAQLTLSGLNV